MNWIPVDERKPVPRDADGEKEVWTTHIGHDAEGRKSRVRIKRPYYSAGFGNEYIPCGSGITHWLPGHLPETALPPLPGMDDVRRGTLMMDEDGTIYPHNPAAAAMKTAVQQIRELQALAVRGEFLALLARQVDETNKAEFVEELVRLSKDYRSHLVTLTPFPKAEG